MGLFYRLFLRLKARWVFGRSDVHVYGRFAVLDPSRISIGANCAINHGVYMVGYGGIRIGDDVVLSAGCMLLDATLETGAPAPAARRPHGGRPITIEDGAWIGAGAIVLPGVTVGSNSIVAAGSVVTKDVPPDSMVAGNPARQVK
jgi:acetyltransferase-like isoleucine patch superfamily enzyme